MSFGLFTEAFGAQQSEHHFWKAIWGKPTMPEMPLTLIPDMYSYHIEAFGSTNSPSEKGGNDNNNPTFAFVYKTFFAGTFINSFSTRCYSIGIQRYWVDTKLKPNLNFALGYRLGGILGYQDRPETPYRQICKYQPIMPLFQVVSDITYRHIGFELGYTMDVFSGSLILRF